MITRNIQGVLNLGRQDRLGDIRLRGELESYRVELDRFAERVTKDGDQPTWVDEATALVDTAQDALDRGDVEEGWFYLHAARRVELDGLDGDQEERRLRARLVLAEAESLDPRDRALIRELIADADGHVQDVSIPALREARRIVDDHNQNAHLKRRYVQEQFQALAVLGIVGTACFVLLGVLAEAAASAVITGPFVDGAATGVGFVPYVLLAGTVGSALFGLVSSLRADTHQPRLPQTISSGWMVLSRAVTGAMSAFVLFLFLRSELLNLGLPESPTFLLLVAVAAGYSERLAPATIENVLEKLESGIENEHESGSGSGNGNGSESPSEDRSTSGRGSQSEAASEDVNRAESAVKSSQSSN